jgi:hypothetical protein
MDTKRGARQMFVKLSYPDPPCVRLNALYKGDCYILNREFRTELATVYMVLANTDEAWLKVVNINTGDVLSHSANCKVIPMVVEVHARPMTKEDENALPF